MEYPESPVIMDDIENMDMDVKYPRGLDLHPRSDLHKRLVNHINERAEAARRVTEGMRKDWKRIDWSLNAYVPANEAELITKNADWRRPVNIVVPMTFASLETFLTYMQSTFARKPIHRYSGQFEHRIAAMLLERVVERQGLWFKHMLSLNTLWRDAFTYGIGACHVRWAKHRVVRSIPTEVTDLLAETLKGTPFESEVGDIINVPEEYVAYEGSRLDPIDPYQILLDPNVSPNTYQDSEYIGWQARTNIFDLMRREPDPEERLFNIKAVRALASGNAAWSRYYADESGRNTRQMNEDTSHNITRPNSHPVDLTHMFIDLVPKDFGLGDEELPEKWMFTVAGDRILIQADRLELDHGMYPIIMAAPNTDGHSILPASYLATTYGMQQGIDFLFTSRMANVRKALNDMILVDPARVEMADILNPEPGKVIRCKRTSFQGESLDAYIKQLNVADVTSQHTRDAQLLIEMLRQTNGTVDIAMGNLNGMPERPTATGIEAAKTGALSRLQRIAQIIGMQCMDDLAWQLAYNSIQFMDEEVAVPVIGRHEQALRIAYGGQNDIAVRWSDLSPFFEVEPHDGSMPNIENVQAWTTILQTMLGVEGVAQKIVMESDVMAIFKHWAKISGASDVNEFVQQGGGMMQPTVMPDQMVQQQAQQGNIVPMQEVAGAVP